MSKQPEPQCFASTDSSLYSIKPPLSSLRKRTRSCDWFEEGQDESFEARHDYECRGNSSVVILACNSVFLRNSKAALKQADTWHSKMHWLKMCKNTAESWVTQCFPLMNLCEELMDILLCEGENWGRGRLAMNSWWLCSVVQRMGYCRAFLVICEFQTAAESMVFELYASMPQYYSLADLMVFLKIKIRYLY